MAYVIEVLININIEISDFKPGSDKRLNIHLIGQDHLSKYYDGKD